jgi:phosphohistidine phosphatase
VKTLFLVRHAKANPPESGLPDHERTLNERGRRDAPEMGRRLKARGVTPDLVITSTAARARTTAHLLASELAVPPERIREDARLYASSAGKLLYLIQELEDGSDVVMLVGHNPEMSELAQHFSRDIRDLPTAAVVRFDLDVDSWSAVGPGLPANVVLDYPKRGQEREGED